MTEPVRVLHIVGAMAPGGLENFIMNLYEHIDREAVQFDFAVHARKPGDYGDRIAELGGRIYELPRLTSHPVRNLRNLNELVRQNGYPVVIRHTANALITPQLLSARRAGAFTVCHSHSVDDPMKALHYAGRLIMKQAASDRMACSEQAGKWMYGKLPFTVIRNAIDIRRFSYDPAAESDIREEFSLQGAHIFGHVGNLVPVKNHAYLLQVFRVIAQKDPKAVLICVGEGEMRGAIEQQVKELQLEGRVILTGMRRDVAKFLSAMDVLLFPSIFEGIPVSLIEAQASSLPCIVSDAVSEEIRITDGLVSFLSIQEDPAIWAEQALALIEDDKKAEKTVRRVPQRENIAKNGYDIDALAGWYLEYFTEKARSRKV